MDCQKALEVLAAASEPTFHHTNQSGVAIVNALQALQKLIESKAPVIVPDNSGGS
jgi:hypothetical protein